MTNRILTTGLVHAAEGAIMVWPRERYDATQRRGVLYMHGSQQHHLWATNLPGTTGLTGLLTKIARLGYPILFCDCGPAPWQQMANDLMMGRVTEAYDYAHSALGYRAGPMHLLGGSMGNLTSLRWAAQNPTKVASICTVIPAFNMEAIRANIPTLRTAIDTAWGVTYPTPLPAGADPIGATISTIVDLIPFRTYYSTDDDPTLMAGAFEAADQMNGDIFPLGPVGHGDASFAAAPAYDIAEFFAQYD